MSFHTLGDKLPLKDKKKCVYFVYLFYTNTLYANIGGVSIWVENLFEYVCMGGYMERCWCVNLIL